MERLSPKTVTKKTLTDLAVHGTRDELYRCSRALGHLRVDLSDDENSRASTSCPSPELPESGSCWGDSPRNRPSDGSHRPGNRTRSPSPAGETVANPFYTAMAKGIREQRVRCLAELAKKAPARFPLMDNTAHRPTSATKPRSDDRPVRGVVTLQADPSSTKSAASVLLVVSQGVMLLQDFTRDFHELLCLQLRHVILKTVEPHDNMFRIMVKARTRDPRSQDVNNSIFVALSDRSLRDRWLEALSDMGVIVKDWSPTQRTATGSTFHRITAPRSCLNGALPPVRWIA